jgi:uncharacterized protein (DUF2141 family)
MTMRKQLLVLAFISGGGANALHAQEDPANAASNTHVVEAFVSGLDPKPGNALFIGLLDKQGNQLQGKRVPVDRTVVLVRFDPVPNGEYAVRFYQDENGNSELDLGLFGIPKEGVGCSNDARGFMSAPSLEDMLFQVSGPTSLSMQVKHY